jgi:hypothetical protein
LRLGCELIKGVGFCRSKLPASFVSIARKAQVSIRCPEASRTQETRAQWLVKELLKQRVEPCGCRRRGAACTGAANECEVGQARNRRVVLVRQ